MALKPPSPIKGEGAEILVGGLGLSFPRVVSGLRGAVLLDLAGQFPAAVQSQV